MDLPVLKNAEGYLKRQTRRRRWHRVFAGLAAVVVFCTTYALILPAITMTAEPFCGIEEHVHSDGCYEMTLVCAQDGADAVSDPAHEHTDDCWQTQQKLICTQEESGGHVHTDGCFDESGALICAQEESGSHVHTDGCFDESGALICTQEESGGHVHTDECFAEETALVCAGEPEAHEHTDDCYEMTLVCTLEEHEHSAACWSDPTADIETAAVWEQTIPQELPEDRREALIAVAQSQLGYRESARNYSVDDAGKTRGYTRYGDWYGDKYGDWCAMFVSFCLHYAGMPESEMPYDANCGSWCAALAERGLYFGAQDYLPQPGDLIFIDRDGDGTADHVGIVKELVSDETETVQIKTIEGNSGNCAAECAHTLGDADILGFGVIPEESEEELAQAASVEALIDALPDNDEISLTLASYEEVEDADGLEEWYAGLLAQISEAKNAYDALSERQQALVENAEKLLALVELVGAEALTSGFDFAAPTTVPYASTRDFIQMNLYDYNGYINSRYDSNKNYPGFQWNGGAYMAGDTFKRHVVDYIDFGNSNITDRSYGESGTSITNGKSANAVIAGVLYTKDEAKKTGAINRLWWDGSNASITNRPVGMSTGTEALSRKLGDDGYPVLADGTSLAYLFTDDNYSVFKQNTESIDGLFQKDETTGAYFYNSRWNHAQYSNNMFTLYNQIITPNFIVYPFGNFLPFNTITDSSKATQVSSITTIGAYGQKIINDLIKSSDYSGSPTKHQLVDMLAKYRGDLQGVSTSGGNAWTTWSARDAIVDYFTAGGGSGDKPSSDTSLISNALLNKMYNIDWDEETNFFFGMDMSMNFIQPRGGLTGNDGQQKMVFYFTGDDDVWVYIDGALFLDLTGIHRHVGGEIDFVNGKVYYYALDTANGGDVSTTPYATYTFEELLRGAGKTDEYIAACLNEKGTFKDYTTHSFKFFYMERGSGSSVCRMNFNFPLLRKNSITVSKELSVDGDAALLGNPDFSFQVLAEDGTLFVGAGVEYEITDAAGNSFGTGTTDANGVFKLKAGQTAVFSGIDENKGKYFVRELLDTSVFEQYGTVSVDGSSITTDYNVTVGSDSFKGLDSPLKNMSDGSTVFRFNNHVDITKLGRLSITKTVEGYSGARLVSQFDFMVSIAGVPLPVGTQYTVGTETRTVTQAGIISLRAVETAVIDNILAESAFTVEELAASAEGYIVSYSVNGTPVSGSAALGTISRAGETVSVAVLNREKGVTAEIPVYKTLNRPDNTEHSFTFTLQQVTDSTGLFAADPALKQELTLTLTASAEGKFLVDYPLSALDGLPKTFYYKITENTGQDSNVIYDASVYVAEVTVNESGGELTADVIGIWKNGAKMEDGGSVAFVNTLGCYELPQTGGAGTTLYTAGGMLLIITAVLGLYRKKPRRREDNQTS